MDINEMKDKVLATLGTAADGAKDLAGRAADGAKDLAGTVADKARSGGRIAKLSMDAAGAREELKKTYQEIGKLCYDLHKDTPEAAFAQLFEAARKAEDSIAALEAELGEQKDSFKEGFPTIEVEITKDETADADFESVVQEVETAVGEELKHEEHQGE